MSASASSFFLLSILLCLIAGVSLDTSNICLVRAARNVEVGKPAMALGILVTTSCASVVFYVNAKFAFAAGMPACAYPDWITVAGAVIYAIGSVINGACAVGTIGRIARGDLGHLATFAGALAIAALVPYPKLARTVAATEPISIALWLYIVLAVAGLMLLVGRRHLRHAEMGAFLALGISSAIVANWRGNWTWLGVLQRLQTGLPVKYDVLACLLSLFLGATGIALFRGRFRYISPNPRTMLREGIGGALMLIGAVLVPGASDALTVYGVPSGSPNAVAGFVLMFVGMVALLGLKRRYLSRRLSAS
jgi:hypothetical protein